MFGDRYFGSRYFGNRYFGPGAAAAVVVSGPTPGAGGRRRKVMVGERVFYSDQRREIARALEEYAAEIVKRRAAEAPRPRRKRIRLETGGSVYLPEYIPGITQDEVAAIEGTLLAINAMQRQAVEYLSLVNSMTGNEEAAFLLLM